MGCISPTVVHKGSSAFLSPCGHCSQCIASQVSAYTFLFGKEMCRPIYKASGSSFVTLTYSNKTLPISPSGALTLSVDDLQRFYKRLRINLQRAGYTVPLKHISAGEYGTDSALPRPHYHCCILGVSPSVAEPAIRRAWSQGYGGLIDVKPLLLSGVGYVCKYLSKSHPFGRVKAEYEARQAQPPFVLQSKQIGVDWIATHLDDIVSSKFTYFDLVSREQKLYPRKVREYVEALTGVDPRPYVDEYMQSIDTHGMTLDDYNSFRDYYHARKSYLQNIKAGKPDYILSNCRLPPLLRRTF